MTRRAEPLKSRIEFDFPAAHADVGMFTICAYYGDKQVLGHTGFGNSEFANWVRFAGNAISLAIEEEYREQAR